MKSFIKELFKVFLKPNFSENCSEGKIIKLKNKRSKIKIKGENLRALSEKGKEYKKYERNLE